MYLANDGRCESGLEFSAYRGDNVNALMRTNTIIMMTIIYFSPI